MVLSATIFRVLSFVYAGLSLVGSLLLLFYRKDLATSENECQFIHLFAVLWLIFNFTLVYGLCLRDTTFIRIHLYYVQAVVWTFVVALFALGVSLLAVLVGLMDEVNLPWASKVGLAQGAAEVLGIIFVVCCALLYVVYSIVKCVLEGFIYATKRDEEMQVSINIVN
uniref:(northern house mosquito) hypothetical protein n=1 Tax=Culex pipiens TaxID=7175 RepID=A0A8D8CQM1_CULPI